MPFPTRDLTPLSRGAEVANLHRALESLGHSVEGAERQRRTFGPTTEALLRELQTQGGLPATGELDQATRTHLSGLLAKTAPFTVYGRVTDAIGQPVAGATIYAVDIDLRRNDPLGSTLTDEEGEYEVRYSAARFARIEKGQADLVVRAHLGDERLDESKIWFNAPGEVRIDLQSARLHGPSEYARLLAEIEPLLGDVPLGKLAAEDCAFLAGETGRDARRIEMFVAAQRMALAELPAEACFGWFVQGLPSELAALGRQTRETLESSLVRAAAGNTVSAPIGEARSKYASTLLALHARRVFESASPDAGAAHDPWLGQINGMLGADRFARFCTMFGGHDEDHDALARRLAAGGFDEKEIKTVHDVLIVKAISRDHAPLLAALGPRTEPRALVAFEVGEWEKLLAARGVDAPLDMPGETAEKQRANYARMLAAEVEARYPTGRFLERARRDLDNRERRLPAHRRQDWVELFSANPSFDLATGDVEARDLELAGVKDRKTLARDLRALQRVFRTVPEPRSVGADRIEGLPFTDRYDIVLPLVEAGLESALAMIAIPMGVFVTTYGQLLGDQEVAGEIHARAAYLGDAASLAVMMARSLTDPSSPAFASAAEYQAMFGRAQLCECEHCRSFLGAAAYFVDTIQFLRDAGTGSNPEHLWHALAGRRPDLVRLALTCANANTPVPYIDLVNEILEEVVVPSAFQRFTLNPAAGFDPIADLDARRLSAPIRAAFQTTNAITLGSDATIDLITLTTDGLRGKRWFLTDRGTMYTIDSDEGAPFANVRSASRQTSGTAEERGAAPEHLHAAAYASLLQRGYPWSLPFDLGWEETRGLLDQGGLPRVDAMEAFGAGIESLAVVCELLGMSLAEGTIIVGPSTAPEQFWNVATGTTGWHAPLAQVALLLERSGLHYVELLNLLETRFINPIAGSGRKLSIVSTDANDPATCDVTKLAIDGIDPVSLDRLHRFVRLQRRLGWSSIDLDIVLHATGASDLTQEALVVVGHVERLRRTLALPVDLIATWLADLETHTYRRYDGDGPQRMASLYERLFRTTIGGLRPDAAFVEDPSGLTGSLAARGSAIRSALALDPATLLALAGVLPDDALTLTNLTRLVRHVTLARGLSLAPADLLRLFRLVGLSPTALPTTALARVRIAWQVVVAANQLRGTELDLDEVEHLLAGTPQIDTRLGRAVADRARVLEELRQQLVGVAAEPVRRERLVRGLASAVGVSISVIESAAPLWSALTTGLAIESGTTTLPGHDVLARLDKLARLIRFLDVPDREAAWLCGNATRLSLPNFLALPLPGDAAISWAAFVRLLDYVEARAAAGAPSAPLFDVLRHALATGAKRGDVLAALAAATGWAIADLEWWLAAAIAPLGPDEVPAALLDPTTYAQLARALAIAQRLGAPAATVKTLVSDANIAASQTLVGLVRARHDATAWLAIAGPLNDHLRVRRRDALVSYLLHARPAGIPESVRTPTDLYAHLLIDVEMSPCMRTSRIKLAVSSLQLFIQRCLMGLEPDGQLANDHAREWTAWRSAYRIWEANRKVFLYPENWVEPELRETRSPFFRELDSELGQAELTTANAERSVRGFLAKLDEVSSLDPVAILREPDGEGETLHVLARTMAVPYVHYYRRRTKLRPTSPGTWTPWERLDMEIDGDHVVLVMLKGRLRVYWAAVREDSPDPTSSMPKWALTFYWSELEDRRWSRRQEVKVAHKCIVLAVPGMSPSEALALRAEVFGNGLRIAVHRWQAGTPMARPKVAASALADGSSPSEERIVSGWIVDSLDTAIPGSTLQVTWHAKKLKPNQSGDVENLIWVKVVRSETLQVSNGHYRFEIPEVPEPDPARPEITLKASYGGASFTRSIPNGTGTDRRSLKLTSVTLPATQFAAPTWPPALAIAIDASDRGALASPLMASLVAPAGMRISGRGFHGEAPTTILGHDLVPPFRLVAVASVGDGGPDSSVYAYRDDESFAFLEDTAVLTPTILGPTLAPALREQASTGVPQLFTRPVPDSIAAGAWRAGGFFDRGAPDQIYAWELFFHVPFLIATRFLATRRFAEARQWLHAIFDPTHTSGAGPERFWRTEPFRELLEVAPATARALLPADPDELLEQVDAMRRDPFRPHAIAALRIAAYMRATFFRYIDVLLEWGDNLFRRETQESLGEATQLYVLAQSLLGARPDHVFARALPAPQTVATLLEDSDFDGALGNAEVEIGQLVIPNLTTVSSPTPSLGAVALFCLPRNDKIDHYRATVEDRLYKVRHCKTLEGGALALSLWDAPIDPALLVRAAEAGLDLQQILDDANAPVHFRFGVLTAKANDLCNDVRGLGAALLAALEKRDAEHLVRLRAGQELALLGRVRVIKQAQIEEARAGKTALERSLALTEARAEHYARLIRSARQPLPAIGDAGGLEALSSTMAAPTMTAGEGTVLLEQESKDFEALDQAQRNLDQASNWDLVAAVAHPFTVNAGAPVFQITANLGMAFGAVASRLRSDATHASAEGTRLTKQASLVMRGYDWALQLKLAARERMQLEAQILAAEIRESIATRELANHEQQLVESREVEAFLRDKYTNEQLFAWTAGEVTKLYFKSYRLAQEVALRAERAYRRELGKATSSFIHNDHWDNVRDGLLAGERLAHDLRRLEVSYLDDSRRQFELTKHVSLAAASPKELVRLRETGHCTLALGESLFDADYPDHELRRIKSVAVSIPAVTGPYTGVHCKLTLSAPKVRRGATLAADATGSTDVIVTSTANSDGGLFEANLRDERFLPFEGAGAIGTWTIGLPQQQNAFDLHTVTDVILHLRYTAIPPSGAAHAVTALDRYCLLDLRREFPDAWHRWKTSSAVNAKLLVDLHRDRLPFTAGSSPTVLSYDVFVRASNIAASANVVARLGTEERALLVPGSAGEYGPLLYNVAPGGPIALGELAVEVGLGGNAFTSLRDRVGDLYLVCRYE